MKFQEDSSMPYLSIVVPFHNSVGRCDSFLNTLLGSSDQRVELVFG